MLIFARNFLSKSVRDGPSTSIVNLKYKNSTIINVINEHPNTYHTNNNNNKIVMIKGFFGFLKNFFKIYKMLKKNYHIEFHCIYDLLGCFAPLIILFFINNKKTIVIYPRGMINKNILIKKKYIRVYYLKFIRFFVKTLNVNIIATSEYEKKQIMTLFSDINEVVVIPNKTKLVHSQFKGVKKIKKSLKIIFFTNITWKKNFPLFCKILNDLVFRVKITIIGSIFINKKIFYKMLTGLKKKHSVNYIGHIDNDKIKNFIRENHLLFLPTYDENFGHVIVENFLLGRPCIISNNTPWNDNIFFNAGYSIPISEIQSYKNAISHYYNMDQNLFNLVCKSSKQYMENKLKNKLF